jgi:periplasmic protein TonB
MPPLRTTTLMSLLVLGIGVTGTAWLSELTYTSSPVLAAEAPHAGHTHAPTHRPRPHVPPSREQAVAATAPQPVPMVPVHAATPKPVPQTRVASAPRLIPVYMPSPRYPMSVLRRHGQGEVVLRVVLNGSGSVARLSVGRSSGDPELDQAAVDAVRTWRFRPSSGRVAGVAADLPVRFELASA